MRVLLLLIIMASIVVSKEELAEECKKREEILGRLLKTWEKEILEAQIYHERMKDVPKEERANIDGFSKMLTSAKNNDPTQQTESPNRHQEGFNLLLHQPLWHRQAL